MKTFKHLVLSTSALALSGVVCAATQGSPSTTSSTGSVTVSANGPVVTRTVQILNLVDPAITNSTRAETNASNPGATVTACVVDTHAPATVAVTLSTANGHFGSASAWKLQTSDTLYTQPYRLDVRSIDNVTTYTTTLFLGTGEVSMGFQFTSTVASTSACGGNNLKLNFTMPITEMPATYPARNYTDVVTIVVSPV